MPPAQGIGDGLNAAKYFGVPLWIEKTLHRGFREFEPPEWRIGRSLISPQRSQVGADIYRNMRAVKDGDLILHLTDNEAFTGISVASSSSREIIRGELVREPWYVIPLRDYQPLSPPLGRTFLTDPQYAPELLAILDETPQVFYTRNLKLQQGKYLTQVPSRLLQLLNNIYRTKTGKNLLTQSVLRDLVDHTTSMLKTSEPL